MKTSDILYYLYYYIQNGRGCIAKRTSETPAHPLELESYTISKDEFDKLSLTELAKLYPFQGII